MAAVVMPPQADRSPCSGPAAGTASARGCRRRRVVANHDILAHLFSPVVEGTRLTADALWQHLLGDLLDVSGCQIDSVLFCWSEGNEAPYPSKVLPTLLDHPIFSGVPEGLDLVRMCCDRTRARRVESLFSLRMNGGDHDRTNGGYQPRHQSLQLSGTTRSG